MAHLSGPKTNPKPISPGEAGLERITTKKPKDDNEWNRVVKVGDKYLNTDGPLSTARDSGLRLVSKQAEATRLSSILAHRWLADDRFSGLLLMEEAGTVAEVVRLVPTTVPKGDGLGVQALASLQDVSEPTEAHPFSVAKKDGTLSFHDGETGVLLEDFEGPFHPDMDTTKIMHTWRENGERLFSMAPRDQETAEAVVDPPSPREAHTLTPKQFRAIHVAEVMTKGVLKRHAEQEWPEPRANEEWQRAVYRAAKDGKDLPQQTLGKLHSINPGALREILRDFPKVKLPDGWRVPEMPDPVVGKTLIERANGYSKEVGEAFLAAGRSHAGEAEYEKAFETTTRAAVAHKAVAYHYGEASDIGRGHMRQGKFHAESADFYEKKLEEIRNAKAGV